MDDHVWIDGPDGPRYHCPVCGVSRCEDYGGTDCVVILRARNNQFDLAGFVDNEHGRWRRWLDEKQTAAEAENARLREQVATLTANRNDWQPAAAATTGLRIG